MKSTHGGYVLLEALVGLLIFSIGILGVLGFQAVATKSTSDSRMRVEVAMLADEYVAQTSINDPATLSSRWCNTTYVTAWLARRSDIPNLALGNLTCPATPTPPFTATITLTWGAPGTEAGTYTTSARIY